MKRLQEPPTPAEVAGLQAFEDAYNAAWGWRSDGPVDPSHPVQRATLEGLRAAVRAIIEAGAEQVSA